MESNLLTQFSERDEYRLVVYLILTLVGAILLVPMTLRAYPNSGAEATVLDLLNLVGADLVVLNMGLLGMYTALLVLFYFDHKKRAQSVILSVVSLIVLILLGLFGLFVGHINLQGLMVFPVGFLVGGILGGGAQLRHIKLKRTGDGLRGRIFTNRSGRPLEFRGAEVLFKIIVFGFILLTFHEAHHKYPSLIIREGCPLGLSLCGNILRFFQGAWVNAEHLPVEILGMTLFGGMLWLFLGYDAQKRIFVIGPPGSGKTHLAFALHQRASKQGDYLVWGDSGGLSEIRSEISTGQNFAERNLATTEKGIREVGFRVATRGAFPKNIEFDTLDYPGEFLPHFAPGLRWLKDDISREDYIDIIRDQVVSGEAQKDEEYADEGLDPFETGTSSPINEPKEAPTDGSGSDFAEAAPTDEPRSDFTEEAPTDEPGSDFDEIPNEEPEMGEAERSEEEDDELSDVPEEERRRRRIAKMRYKHMTSHILPRIKKADTLLYLIDLERMARQDGLWTNNYSEIQEEIAEVEDRLYAQLLGFFNQETDLGPLKAELYVATKADFFVDEMMDDEVTEVMQQDYESFRENVNQHLQGNIELTGLLDYSDRPYPVFLKGQEGDRRQMDMAGGDPTLYGFKQLLDDLGR